MAALISGLVSITFRALSPQEVIELAVSTGLKAIEWGGDIHVPHGDVTRAEEVRELTHNAGLLVAAYGSYYRLGEGETSGLPFERVLASATALGAPNIRVWAGGKGSGEVTAHERQAIIDDAFRVADLAQEKGISVGLEYHGGTLTDSRVSVRHLLDELSHPNLNFLWQPANGETVEQSVERLQDVLPRIHHAHVFHWWPSAAERRPLAEGEDRWLTYLKIIQSTGKNMPCLLEFVRDDSPDQFRQDAATLLRWMKP